MHRETDGFSEIIFFTRKLLESSLRGVCGLYFAERGKEEARPQGRPGARDWCGRSKLKIDLFK